MVTGLYARVLRSFNPSQVKIVLKNGELKVSFVVNSADQINLQNLLENFDVGNLNDQGLKIKLGDETFALMDKVFRENHLIDENGKPLSLNLIILPREIDFDNKRTFGLFEQSEVKLLKNPSPEGNIKTQAISETGYTIEIDNPEQVFATATASGKLKVSARLADFRWWQLLSKLAKIQLRIDNGSLNGTILLK